MDSVTKTFVLRLLLLLLLLLLVIAFKHDMYNCILVTKNVYSYTVVTLYGIRNAISHAKHSVLLH